jgi:polysaccharide biosynthesis transport protein
MLSQSGGSVVDLDDSEPKIPKGQEAKSGEPSKQVQTASRLSNDKARLAAMLSHYTPDHPDVRKLRKQIEQAEAAEAAAAAATAAARPVETPSDAAPKAAAQPEVARVRPPPTSHVNPVIQSQLTTLDAEIAKHKEETQRLTRQVSAYQAKLSAIPVREQEITQLVRDYEISKNHYSQLLGQQLSAETATQLEIRQKGEKFDVLDAGQVAERPSRPNRALINGAGAAAGLVLGILCAVGTELLGISITSPEDLTAATGIPVLEVIPLILTRVDRRRRMKRMLITSLSAVATVLAVCAILFFRSQT